MYGGRYTPCASFIDRPNPDGVDSYTSRVDQTTPPEMEIANCLRSFHMSRLKAAEVLNKQLSDDASTNSRLHTLHPPGECNVNLAIEQLRAQLLCLVDADIDVIRHLLAVNEQIEEIKWQRKYGMEGSSRTPSNYMSSSCTADVESVDLDPDMDYTGHPLAQPTLFKTDHGVYDGRHVVGRDVDDEKQFNDDVTDDVFQNDDSVRGPSKTSNTPLSDELRFKVSNNNVGSTSQTRVKSLQAELKIRDRKPVEVGKTTKVEFRVNCPKYSEAKRVSSRANPAKVKDKLETTKVEFKVDSAKGIPAKTTASKVEIRFTLQPHGDKNQNHPNEDSRCKKTSEVPCQTGTANSVNFQRGTRNLLSGPRSDPNRNQPSSGGIGRNAKDPISNLRIINLARRHDQMESTKKEHSQQVTDENTNSETVVSHL